MVIIGAGPTGIASAIYLKRAGRDIVVMEQRVTGGLLRSANLVENYPGFPGGIRGLDLAQRFSEQLDLLGIKVVQAEVRMVTSVVGIFKTETSKGDFFSTSAIVASGTRPKKPCISGATRLEGRKVFTELVDMPLSAIYGKTVVVIGGGDSAFDYSLNLMSRGAKVIIVSRSNPVCLSLLRGRADEGGIDVIVGLEADDIKGSTGKVTVHGSGKAGEREIEADYILLACGREPNSDIIDFSLRVQTSKHDDIPRTNIPGLFMAGDVVRGKHRQAAISVGDGVNAGMMADEYLKSMEASR